MEKKNVPNPSILLNELLSPTDILKEQQYNTMVTLAESRTEDLRNEIDRRLKLDGIKEALEKEDFYMLSNIFREVYGESMISAGKKLIISTVALTGERVDDEVHIEETVGEWINDVYENTGLDGLLDWTKSVDTALQVVEEYNIVFESELAKKKTEEEKDEYRRNSVIASLFSDL